ncbi:MAG TPA: YheC/YheD family protein, partial [Syntrophomonadaceae bacterium]|nr:YheC/YheD family protein [Syntrophomonadaceae bacterium]
MNPHEYYSPPTVGILASVTRSQKGFPVGKETKIIKEKFAMAKKYGINLFIFYPDGINWKNKTIIGCQFISSTGKKGYWVKRTFPFPDIVYNRIRDRQIEKQPPIKQLLRRLYDDPNIKLLNRRFFDKWEVYKVLLSDPTTSDMVPRTRLLSSANLKHYLSRRSMVYIKPRRNNAARGIVKVVRTPGVYLYCQAQSSPPQWERRVCFDGLWRQLRVFIKNPNNYVVQMGIDLCKVDERIVDFRAQVQKDGNGEWVFTGIEARLAQKGRIATTGSVYGTRVSFKKTINNISRSEDFKSGINEQLAHLYQAVPQVLEKKLGLSLAVLSIDIGIDTNGKVWIIEVSSKPEPFAS